MQDIRPDEVTDFRQKMLGWYDKHRRALPWRALSGQEADPYRVWLSEIMLQQTTVAAVIPYFQKFTEKWPTVFALAQAEEGDIMKNWAGLGYYARARNLIKCAQVIARDYDGQFPRDIHIVRSLPGIGDYTSASVAAIAFGLEANVVDGNIERVMARYHAVTETLPKAKVQLKALAGGYTIGREDRTGDYAQALMDLGATICTPKSPACALCPINQDCSGYRQGIAETLPLRAAKVAKPHKIGNVFWIENAAGQILVETRPNKGLLGGMPGLPTSQWVLINDYSKDDMPEGLNLRAINYLNIEIEHSFTHFDLTLKLVTASLPDDHMVEETRNISWVGRLDFKKYGFPTVFQKAVNLYL